MKPLSARCLAEIKARAELATQGPWEVYPSPWVSSHWHVSIGKQGNHRHHVGDVWLPLKQNKIIDTTTVSWTTVEQAQRNTEFIAHAREDVPALIAEIERLHALLAESMGVIPASLSATPTIRCDLTLDELCAALEARGITFDRNAAKAGRLEVDAPRGALTPDLHAALAFHRTELLEVLAAMPTPPSAESNAGGDA